MKFEYDHQKSAINEDKHGISFERAKILWSVPAVEIEANIVDEPRYMIIGKIDGRFYSCIYTTRGNNIRLIPVRRSRKKGERIYHDHFKT